MKSKQITKRLPVALVATLGLTLANANAAFIIGDILNVDLSLNTTNWTADSNDYSAGPSGQGDMWNAIGKDVTAKNLVEANNTAAVNSFSTAITFTQTNNKGQADNQYYHGGGVASGTSSTNNLMNDYHYVVSATAGQYATYAFNNLDAGTYELYAYQGGTLYSAPKNNTFTVNGVTKTLAQTSPHSTTVNPSDQGGTWDVWSVTLASAGSISIQVGNGNANEVYVHGFQLAAIPEPSAALLGGLGFLALLRRRR
jgi:hypothetical protein